ncbi:MAG TPA: hypothetical protein VH590_19325 [Ktedonobacterales bacterium]
MRRRSRRPDPGDPTQWVGQPYTPHDPYYYVTGPGRWRSPLKGLGMYGYALLIVAALTVGALIFVGFTQTNGLGFWVLLALIGAAIIGALAGAASARRRRQANQSHRHHKHHQTS